MLKLNSSVTEITNVGPRYKALLARLNVFTVKDLIYHVPFRYEDHSEIKKISQLLAGENVNVKATLGQVTNIYTKFGKRLTKTLVADFSGQIDVLWFNQQYLKKFLQPGKIYILSGRVGDSGGKKCLLNPEIELYKNGSLNFGRIVGIYPETLGVSSKWLRARINDVLNENLLNEDFLPEEIKKSQNLKDLKWSLDNIHFPQNLSLVDEAKHRLAFDELFTELLIVAKRKDEWANIASSNPIKPDKKRVESFVQNLPFALTESQITAYKEILDDLSRSQAMNRLLEGDVGTGKTVVSAIAAYSSWCDGYKTLFLAPTEILAQQHFKTFKALLEKYGLNIGLSTSATNSKIDNNFDILIGTHALLFNQEKYKKIGLVVIDEQHRFGVEQRGKLLEMAKDRHTPHLLTMTATPIPRTLALTLYGDLDISTLKTFPNSKRNVTTKILSEEKRNELYKWVLQKKLSTFVVCPLIETSESESFENVKSAEQEYEALKNGAFAKLEIGLVHGKMSSREKAKIIDSFREGKIKVLVATPVIEVGIDIPDAAVMIIESGERYGLASLHQLRGRIGRDGNQAHCFVFMSNFSKTAYTRLKNLENIEDGLKLAEMDMKYRGQGDIFSTMQHGFKRLKFADLSNIVLLEQAKIQAQKVIKNPDKYSKIFDYLTRTTGTYVLNN